ncbi:MAG: spermidine synthase [Polyangiaceae bacterium]
MGPPAERSALAPETPAADRPLEDRRAREEHAATTPERSEFAFVAAIFLVSGATGLLYEVAFSKVLATIFGATAFAISTVLSAFMAGLALGAHLGGRFASRIRRPLFAYGVAELAVGAIAAGTPFVFDFIASAYVGFASANPDSLVLLTLMRGGLTFVAILVPTACMGATLPFLSRVVSGTASTASRLPRLYAVNTLGGALGSLLSAYAILPLLGIRGTMRAAAVINVAIGLAAMLRGRRLVIAPAPAEEPPPASDPSSRLARRLALFAAASGFLVFSAEVVETHLLTLLIGNSAYAFGLMLAVFLVCLGVGAARSAAFAKKHGRSALARGLLYAALTMMITLPLWAQLPHFFSFAGKHVASWAGREVCRWLAAIVILVWPTYWMGTTFPLLLEEIGRTGAVAKGVGRLTVVNTLGTIVGSIATGYLVLPLLGSEWSLRAVAIVFALLGLYALQSVGALEKAAMAKRGTQLLLGAAGAALVLAGALPRWNLARMTNGANVYFTHGPPPDAIDFVREDVHGGVTTVVRRGELHTLLTNGKFQGDDGAEMKAQRRFAHYPALFVENEKRALVIGLGTGATLGTVTAYPFEGIDLAEISPAIVEASKLFYGAIARNSLDDKRVKIHLNDGRNVLLVAQQPYDLITIELTSVWFAGASNLYSKEFYDLAKKHLVKGGVLQQWVQLHHIHPREVAAIIKTLRTVFAHVALFEGGSQGILVASDRPLVASRLRLEALETRLDIQDTLEPGHHLADLMNEMIAADDALDRFVADTDKDVGGVPVSTDDNLYLEYATPKGNVMEYQSSLEKMLGVLHEYRSDPAEHLGP